MIPAYAPTLDLVLVIPTSSLTLALVLDLISALVQASDLALVTILVLPHLQPTDPCSRPKHGTSFSLTLVQDLNLPQLQSDPCSRPKPGPSFSLTLVQDLNLPQLQPDPCSRPKPGPSFSLTLVQDLNLAPASA